MKRIQLSNLHDTKKELHKLKTSQKVEWKNWNISEICLHCAQTIEYSMTGYPKMKPLLLRITVGKLAVKKFLRQGYMKHDLTAPVPGGSSIKTTLSKEESIDELMKTIRKFESFPGTLKPHLLFGHLTKDDYDTYFAMHIADHLSELDY
jgi:hypothetical protein